MDLQSFHLANSSGALYVTMCHQCSQAPNFLFMVHNPNLPFNSSTPQIHSMQHPAMTLLNYSSTVTRLTCHMCTRVTLQLQSRYICTLQSRYEAYQLATSISIQPKPTSKSHSLQERHYWFDFHIASATAES